MRDTTPQRGQITIDPPNMFPPQASLCLKLYFHILHLSGAGSPDQPGGSKMDRGVEDAGERRWRNIAGDRGRGGGWSGLGSIHHRGRLQLQLSLRCSQLTLCGIVLKKMIDQLIEKKS